MNLHPVKLHESVTILLAPLDQYSAFPGAVDAILKETRLPFELIIIEGNAPESVRLKLERRKKQHKNIKIIYSAHRPRLAEAFNLGLPHIRTDLLYAFVHVPSLVNQHFLGFLDLTTSHHLILTGIIVVLQYVVIKLSLSRTKGGAHMSPAQKAAQAMQQKMMLYLFPGMMAFIAYSFPGAVGLYLAISSAVSLGQEWLIRRKPL